MIDEKERWTAKRIRLALRVADTAVFRCETCENSSGRLDLSPAKK